MVSDPIAENSSLKPVVSTQILRNQNSLLAHNFEVFEVLGIKDIIIVV